MNVDSMQISPARRRRVSIFNSTLPGASNKLQQHVCVVKLLEKNTCEPHS